MPRTLQFSSDNEEEMDQFELELDGGDNFSPHRTRSGRVYPASHVKKRRGRMGRGEGDTTREDGDMADCEENGDDSEDCYRLPPVVVAKKMFSQMRERRSLHGLLSSPVRPSSPLQAASSPTRVSPALYSLTSSPVQSASPPTCSLDMLDLLSSPTKACALASPCSPQVLSSTAPRSSLPRSSFSCSRLKFDNENDVFPSSCPLPTHLPSSHTKRNPVKTANVNPFTPQAILEASKRKFQSSHDQSYSPSWVMSQSDCSSQNNSLSPVEDSEQDTSLPAKRLRVSEMSITRYQEEFLELANVATGQFGLVVRARHRLDGIVYAIKITKKNIRANSYDEKMAMNEVFAHAALMKHKHVVRYFNSWVERGQIYIQNEFCEGGSLEQKIEGCRESGQLFSEEELRRLLLQVGKGLKYIHSRQLVHLDIKPGNILLAIDRDPDPAAARLNLSSDSGAASGGATQSSAPPQFLGNVQYKIGDLGHMNLVQGGEISPTEGDCRYMAPEFLLMEPVEAAQLVKADMFSTGMTLYEAASLQHLPRNSEDSRDYEKLKRGMLPPLPNFSREFYSILRSLVHYKPVQRTSASKLVSNPHLNPLATKSKSQLWRELHQTKLRVVELEQQVNSGQQVAEPKKRSVGMGVSRSNSVI
eukprot:GFUD01044821.1.p1 GENE.GFUD01044821.1~~GFUD01044821.1.p1  ORF type:complete len:644 (-),score=129.77 GFUD01044821.1:140-2071(-)